MEKINIAELLRNCPKGMELDCTIYENTSFVGLTEDINFPIRIRINFEDTEKNNWTREISLTSEGKLSNHPNAKCIIFPKGKTTWEGFHRPFVEGDVIYVYGFIAILSNITENGLVWYHCYYCNDTKVFKAKRDFGIGNIKYCEFRFANEEEKRKLFNTIKANGYQWNAETKTLEKLVKPIFEVGNKIEKCGCRFIIAEVKDDYYLTKCGNKISFDNQNEYKLISNKFDINTLVPFESRVLVRDTNIEKWKSAFWGFYDIDNAMNYPYECCGNAFAQCIPYEHNEHLHGTTNDCDEFYKTW